jgi:nucleoside phosphorylase
MTQPWTHENIQIMKQNTGDANHIRPHPYFITKLHHRKGQVLDYCIAGDLFHMYPNILSLGMVLVEIATKQPFKPKTSNYAWDKTTINDYYEWAWTTANSSDLRNTIGAAYQAVVNNCLDAELFKGSACDLSKPDDGLENRQTILYEKIVLPLRELYYAYKDDWEVLEVSTMETPIIKPQTYTSSSKPTSRSHFSIAIFCALPLEADAVSELFDETWNEDGERFGRAAGDDNAYTFGNILHHNVVLIHMAGVGKAAASQAASSVRSSYPEIKLALVVGVCGGVPSYSEGREDLILGDVVISDGIVQYDFGRRFPDVFLSKSGPEVVSRPGPKLRGILAKLKGVRRRERLEAKLLENLEGLQNTLGSRRAGYPGVDTDELYHEAYRHKHRNPSSCKTCAYEEKDYLMCEQARLLTCQQVGCQKSRLVQRKRLLEASADGVIPKPRVHFGFVGSKDTVMKSGHHRDLTAAQHNLIAFEMEAYGIWDNLPCLVIKGVCDYADSHKNKHWQHYAAATAAACMKAVLEEC